MLFIERIGCFFNQSSDSPTTSTTLCKTQTIVLTETVTVSYKHNYVLHNPTSIVTILPALSPSLTSTKNSHLMTTSTVYITRSQAHTPSIVTATNCPQILSDIVQISILATSGVLICLPITALVIVTYCWGRTRQILKEKRSGSGVNFDLSTQDR